MAEKKVSGKIKNKNSYPERDSSYDDFLAQYGQQLRRRSTQTVAEPVKKRTADSKESRCEAIDPHTTVNPAVEHQILTKRTGRILSDDTGFKAKSYHQRFELTPEMPELREEPVQEELTQIAFPGQQTMADMISENENENAAFPVDSLISESEEDPFTLAYKAFRNDSPLEFGKSEKLRAIARTAADDAGMEPESQLSFPAFDPLFRFPEEKASKRKIKIKKSDKKHKEANDEKQIFDIDEKDIVTGRSITENSENEQNEEAVTNKKTDRNHKFFDFLADSGASQEIEAPFEISSKNDIKTVLDSVATQSRIALIKSAALLILGIVSAVILFVLDSAQNVAYCILGTVFLLLGGIICIKDFADGIRDITKKKISVATGALLIYISALLQALTSFFASGENRILAPAILITLSAVTLPRFLLSNNSRLTVGLMASGNISIFRNASDSGIDGAVKAKFAGENNILRYSSQAAFATGLMKKLTNAVPKPFGLNAAYIIILFISLVAGIASAIISHSAMTGITGFTAMLTACLPVSYLFTASLMLYNTNNILAKNKSSLISYRCAEDVTKTKAVVFNAADIIEKSACSIHGVKAFGSIDPKEATLYCAAAINAGLSPLSEIMKQVTDQSDDEIPDADDVQVFSSLGIMATVNKKQVLLGSREFLKNNNVYVPEENYETKFLTGDRKLLYLAVDGSFTMLLIVSYHIKRSVSAFFKYLTANSVNLVIHSADPNITPEYIAKKCKIKPDTVFETGDAEGAYFLDKEKKTETALPADVFTDGKMSSISTLVRKAFLLTRGINILPFAVYILSAVSALLIIFPLFLGAESIIGSLYILIIRILSFAISYFIINYLRRE